MPCRRMTMNEVNQVGDALPHRLRGRLPAPNQGICRLIADFAIATKFPQNANGETVCPREVALAATVFAYGELGEIPEAVWDAIYADIQFAAEDDLRAMERVMCWGILDYFGNDGWQGVWSRALDAFVNLVKIVIEPRVEEVGYRIAGHQGQALAQWTDNEAMSCASILALMLISGAQFADPNFVKRGAAFKVTPDAARRIVERVDLRWWAYQAGWNVAGVARQWKGTTEPLAAFLKRTLAKAPMARANEYRKTPLAWTVNPPLASGKVLRCPRQECANGTIGLDDRCTQENCHAATSAANPVTDASWWIWEAGTRIPCRARRCEICGGLFFQPGSDCGEDGKSEHQWTDRPTEVWV